MQAVELDPPSIRRSIEETFARQRAARPRVAASTAAERIARLRLLKKTILDRRQELYDALASDLGKGLIESEFSELYPFLIEINDAIRHLRTWLRPRRVRSSLLLTGARSEIRSEPRGMVLIITPWNYPLYLGLGALIPAVGAGNSVILKPSEKAPAMSRFIARVIGSVFPEDEVAVVEGDADAAEALLAQPFDHLFFTGGARIARKVMEAAAVHLASVTLELGGKCPAIVDETADVELTAERLVWGKFLNAGQTCVAPDYVLVHAAKATELEGAMNAVLDRFYGAGDAAKKATPDYCRMLDSVGAERMRELIEDAVARGARLVAGGSTSPGERYVAPTILSDVDPDAAVMQEEVFGPVLPMIAFSTLDEAIQFVRRHDKPLSLYVFSRNEETVDRVLRETSAGGVSVNGVVLHIVNPSLPFGGVGGSGFGSYHGEFGFREFSHQKAVMVQTRYPFVRLFYPPFAGRGERVAALLRRYFSWM